MGTQQLLLIVLGFIIVGIGVVLGIGIFDANAAQSYRDAITQDCLHLASSAQGFYRKPAALGGGENTFDNIDIADCGMEAETDMLKAENMNATYEIAGRGQTFTVTAVSKTESEKSVVLICDMSQPENSRISVSFENW